MPRKYDEEDSDETLIGDKYSFLRYKIKALEVKVEELQCLTEDYEKQIRVLEDYKLATTERHKEFMRWVGIMCAAISAVVSLLEHLVIK